MTNLMIPIDDALLARLQQLARYHGRNVTTEARILLTQLLENNVQPLTGDFLHSFFKDIPEAQYADEELVTEPRSRYIDKDINSIRSPLLRGAIAAMIRADKKAKALQKEQVKKKSDTV